MSKFIVSVTGVYYNSVQAVFASAPAMRSTHAPTSFFSSYNPIFPTTIFILFHPLHALSNCIFFTHNSKIEFVTEFDNLSIIPIKIKQL